MAVQPTWNYLCENELQYGILSTYDYHWFLYKPKNAPSELYISEALSLESKCPVVLMAYAYMAWKAVNDCHSRYPSIILTQPAKNRQVLDELLKEIKAYNDLADIQGKYIPKLRANALEALREIHKHGILHDDIRAENILVSNQDDVYIIDFGMSNRADIKKKRKWYQDEMTQLSCLLDQYTRCSGP
ncbi:11206_t:CDS:2 [Paraglomus occultum]|uniref:11206_t:CDS:1 n=1 Tax=Paraglomus occultum TaxID=144539 RepID=A0A9N8ZGG2_9GLOM|nr:11206_t:CDS:2 [Paraglomus occultum]